MDIPPFIKELVSRGLYGVFTDGYFFPRFLPIK